MARRIVTIKGRDREGREREVKISIPKCPRPARIKEVFKSQEPLSPDRAMEICREALKRAGMENIKEVNGRMGLCLVGTKNNQKSDIEYEYIGPLLKSFAARTVFKENDPTTVEFFMTLSHEVLGERAEDPTFSVSPFDFDFGIRLSLAEEIFYQNEFTIIKTKVY